MFYSAINAVGQARLDDFHRQAERDALARAARRARRARRRQGGTAAVSRTGAAGVLRRRLHLVTPR